MSQVQLQVKPRRVRCRDAAPPPPFEFTAGREPQAPASAARTAVLLPLRAIWGVLGLTGRVIDLAFFLTALTIWCGLHLTLWSYAFEMGPAANCFDLPCPGWITGRIVWGCAGLAVLTFASSRFLRRLGHTATSHMLLLLVTFDVAALMFLGIHSLT